MMGGPLPPKRPRAAHAGLVDLLGYNFHEPKLLEQALTHPSLQAGNGSAGRGPYERLEFLGDRVLGLVVAEMLYNRFPGENEGALARRHAALVRRESLARIAQQSRHSGRAQCRQIDAAQPAGRHQAVDRVAQGADDAHPRARHPGAGRGADDLYRYARHLSARSAGSTAPWSRPPGAGRPMPMWCCCWSMPRKA
jgi:hypothetical protein